MRSSRSHPQILPVVSCAIERNERILVLRRAHSPGLGQWAFPAGHVEVGETAEQAIAREIHEETGLVVRPVIQRTWSHVSTQGHAYLGIFFTAILETGEVVLNDESLAFQWLALAREHILAVDWAFETHRDAALQLATSHTTESQSG